jgi:hypothetical protein
MKSIKCFLVKPKYSVKSTAKRLKYYVNHILRLCLLHVSFWHRLNLLTHSSNLENKQSSLKGIRKVKLISTNDLTQIKLSISTYFYKIYVNLLSYKLNQTSIVCQTVLHAKTQIA